MNAKQAMDKLRRHVSVATVSGGYTLPNFAALPLSRQDELEIANVIGRLERERDEARAAYCNLLESVRQISGCYPQMEKDLYLVSQAYKDKPEWRKDTT